MGDLAEKAKSKGVKLLLVNGGESKDASELKKFAAANGAGNVAHYQFLEKPNFTKYFPYHVVAKDGKVVMSGGYDMTNRRWKDWEGLAGLK